jgi:hypothetical protein
LNRRVGNPPQDGILPHNSSAEPTIDYCIGVGAPGDDVFGGGVEIKVGEAVQQAFAQHFAQALAPVCDGAIPAIGVGQKRSYRG